MFEQQDRPKKFHVVQPCGTESLQLGTQFVTIQTFECLTFHSLFSLRGRWTDFMLKFSNRQDAAKPEHTHDLLPHKQWSTLTAASQSPFVSSHVRPSPLSFRSVILQIIWRLRLRFRNRSNLRCVVSFVWRRTCIVDNSAHSRLDKTLFGAQSDATNFH